jgi:hypothetical protein
MQPRVGLWRDPEKHTPGRSNTGGIKLAPLIGIFSYKTVLPPSCKGSGWPV